MPRSIRRADRRDVGTLVRLWVELTEHHAKSDPYYRILPGAEAEIERLLLAAQRDPDTEFWLADVGAEGVGFCSARIDAAPPIHAEVERAEITDLWVAPEQRRCGLGRELVVSALAWVAARDVRRIEVRVAAANPEGQAFWRALGFTDFVDVLHRRL